MLKDHFHLMVFLCFSPMLCFPMAVPLFPCFSYVFPWFFPSTAHLQVVPGLDRQRRSQPPTGARLGAGAGGDQRGHPGRLEESKTQDALRGRMGFNGILQ